MFLFRSKRNKKPPYAATTTKPSSSSKKSKESKGAFPTLSLSSEATEDTTTTESLSNLLPNRRIRNDASITGISYSKTTKNKPSSKQRSLSSKVGRHGSEGCSNGGVLTSTTTTKSESSSSIFSGCGGGGNNGGNSGINTLNHTTTMMMKDKLNNQLPVVHFSSQYDPTIPLETYTFILELDDITLNTIGMEKLLQAAKPSDCIAQALVFGGSHNVDLSMGEVKSISSEQLFRYQFVQFLSNDFNDIEDLSPPPPPPPRKNKNKKSNKDKKKKRQKGGNSRRRSNVVVEIMEESDYDDLDDWDDDDLPRYPRGSNHGVLHLMALKVLAGALNNPSVVDITRSSTIKLLDTANNNDHHPIIIIDFCKDKFWSSIVETLIDNLQEEYSQPITIYTLRCLRLLYLLSPKTVGQMINMLLLPFVLNLQQSPFHQSGRITYEATQLLKLTMPDATTMLFSTTPSKTMDVDGTIIKRESAHTAATTASTTTSSTTIATTTATATTTTRDNKDESEKDTTSKRAVEKLLNETFETAETSSSTSSSSSSSLGHINDDEPLLEYPSTTSNSFDFTSIAVVTSDDVEAAATTTTTTPPSMPSSNNNNNNKELLLQKRIEFERIPTLETVPISSESFSFDDSEQPLLFESSSSSSPSFITTTASFVVDDDQDQEEEDQINMQDESIKYFSSLSLFHLPSHSFDDDEEEHVPQQEDNTLIVMQEHGLIFDQIIKEIDIIEKDEDDDDDIDIVPKTKTTTSFHRRHHQEDEREKTMAAAMTKTTIPPTTRNKHIETTSSFDDSVLTVYFDDDDDDGNDSDCYLKF